MSGYPTNLDQNRARALAVDPVRFTVFFLWPIMLLSLSHSETTCLLVTDLHTVVKGSLILNNQPINLIYIRTCYHIRLQIHFNTQCD